MLEKLKKLKLVSWNCRGLGNLNKCDVVRSVLRQSRCDVCMLQETKLNEYNLNCYSRHLPSFFDKNVAVVHANNSAGGILIAWKRSYQLLNCWTTRNSCSALLKQTCSGGTILVTNVYGPSTDALKQGFIKELRSILSLVNCAWIIGGDFNLVRWMTDRSGLNDNFTLMSLFNDFIRDTGLIDVPLENRRFTWSSGRPQPSHSKIDRVFIDSSLTLQFPIISLQALPQTISDHAPLLLTCTNEPSPKRSFKLELFWLSNPEASNIIHEAWEAPTTPTNANQLFRFTSKCRKMHNRLRAWHCQNFSELEDQLQFCNRTILFFDQVEEERTLAAYEHRFRIMVKERAYYLACITESRWHHRSRCKWLQAGDQNTRYFHAIASARHRRNTISSLTVQDQTITDATQIR